MTKGKLVLIGCGPGAIDLLTYRAADRIRSSDVVLYDRLVGEEIVQLANEQAELVYVGKKCGDGGRQQSDINDKIRKALLSGKTVSRLKSGDPMIFGRATEEIATATLCGAEVEIVPGVTASLAAAADANVALTEREEIQNFVMTTARTAKDLNVPDWSEIARPGTCVSFYMGVAQAERIRLALLNAGVPAEATAEWVERAGQPISRIVSTSVDRMHLDAAQNNVKNPAVLIVRYPVSLAQKQCAETAALSFSNA